MTWSEEMSARYEAWSADVTDDVPFYADLAKEAEGPLVELAVGNGRVAIPVANLHSVSDDLSDEEAEYYRSLTAE